MKIGLGTAQFGLDYGVANERGKLSLDNASMIINYARLNGIKTLDTAISYGHSEDYLGHAGVKDFDVITKLPKLPSSCLDIESWVNDHISSSLNKIKINSLYGILLHNPEDIFSKNGLDIINALSKLKSKNKVKKIGLSIYSPEDIDLYFKVWKFDIVQTPFNILDQRLCKSGLLKKLKDHNVEVHTRSCFLQGLLTLPVDKIPNKFKKWNNLWKTWHDWLELNKLSPIEACLLFNYSFDGIDRIIVGVDNMQQLKEIIKLDRKKNLNFPEIDCQDTQLINPTNWSKL